MTDYKDAVETMEIETKKRGGKNKLFLIISGGVLVVALIVCAVVLLLGAGPADDAERVIELGTVMQGVSVNGIDISGMTRDEALEATSGIEAELFAKANFTVDVNGTLMNFTAQDFALQTDYEAMIAKAIAYGRAGTFEERLTAANAAKESPVDFPVTVTVDETNLKTALTALKAQLDTEAVDATVTFAPWGYTAATAADGTTTYAAYMPDLPTMISICKAYASGKEYADYPEMVRTADEDMPNALRYQSWDNNHYLKEDIIPDKAHVSRFIYTESVDGLVVDADYIFDAVKSQVESGTYETIVTPFTLTPAAVTLDQIKSQTQLISSWTTSYSDHYNSARNYNVAMMSTLLNGAVIEPGETWSVNDTAGPRNATTAKTYGWKEAAGIENGGYTPQYGGGVCQLGSTVFNAAIRSGLKWTEHWHHSIPSGYIPLGLDSTLDSPHGNYAGKDLKLLNETQYKYYLVSFVNPKDKTVTVEFYGVPLTNANGDQIILDYSWKNLGRYGSPTSSVKEVDEGYECPDGTIISASGTTSYQFANESSGTIVQTYQITMGLDGTPIGDPVEYEYYKYPVINGIRYVLKTPEATPAPSTETSPSTSTSPETSPETSPST